MKTDQFKIVPAVCAVSLLSFGAAPSGLALSGQESAPYKPFPDPAAVETNSGNISEADAPAGAFIEGEGRGWLRAYATGDLPAGERMLMADYYESEIEMAVREELAAALAGKSVETSSDDDSAPFQITYSAELTAAGKRKPAQSILRIEPERGGADDPSTFGREVPATGFRPAIAIGGGGDSKPKGPTVAISIFVVGGGARVWSGFAETELSGRSPRELARILTSALMAHWGENASFDDVRFVDPAAPGAHP